MKIPFRKQLIEAGKIAQEMLEEKRIVKKGLLARILLNPKTPPLPGIPPYIPHLWTIKLSQRMMYDLLRGWQNETKNDVNRQENLTWFIKYVMEEMNMMIKSANTKVVAQPMLIKAMKETPVLKDVFAPLNQRRVAKEMQKFFYDSFAVAVVEKQHDCVSDYADWFLEWTKRMELLWTKNKNTK